MRTCITTPVGVWLECVCLCGLQDRGVAHTWVMTLAPDSSVAFWESLTAERLHCSRVLNSNMLDRFPHKPIDPDHPAGVPVPQLEHPYQLCLQPSVILC